MGCLHIYKEHLCFLTLYPIDFIYQESADFCKYAPSGKQWRSSFGKKVNGITQRKRNEYNW